MFSKLSVTHKISASVGAVILAVVVTFGVVVNQIKAVEREALRESRIESLQTLWASLSSTALNDMQAMFKPVTRNRDLIESLDERNASGIRSAVGPTLTRLTAQNTVDNLIIVDSARQVAFSGDSSVTAPPQAAIDALTANRVVQSISESQSGDIRLQVAIPLYKGRGFNVGAAVYETSIASIAKQMQAAIDGGVSVFSADKEKMAAFGSVPEGIASVLGNTDEFRVETDEGETTGNVSIPVVSESASGEGTPLGHIVKSIAVSEKAAEEDMLAWLLYGAMAISLIVAVAVVAFLTGRTLRPLGHVREQLEAVSSGDLTRDLTTDRGDEFGDLIRSVQVMSGDLKELIEGIAQTAQAVSAGAEQVSRSGNETGEAVQQQRSEVDMLTSAINEMSASASEIAENIHNLSENAASAMESVKNGSREVSRSIDSIEDLSAKVTSGGEVVAQLKQRSEEIGSIVDVIKAVADQTNLLALNAAIEAARAGEQGRGFAVVAEEVRSLAGKTQQSTEEIEQTIEAIQSSVADAVEVMNAGVEQAGEVSGQAKSLDAALGEIQTKVGDISELSEQVASAAEQQSSTAEEMNKNVHRVAQVADETASRSRESGEAVESLVGEAKALESKVSRFRV